MLKSFSTRSRPGAASVAFGELRKADVGGWSMSYRVAGEGPPLVLLHGDGVSSVDWSWVLPAFSRNHRVYAPDLLGSGVSDKPRGVDYSAAWMAGIISAFMDSVGVGSAAMVGSSIGAQTALRLALSEPARVSALVLSNGTGLGQAMNPLLPVALLPGVGDLSIQWAKMPPGALQRALTRAAALFALPWRAPREWVVDQVRLARTPGFVEAALAAPRSQVGPSGQREILLDELPNLKAPTLIVWGDQDRIVPVVQAREAAARLGDREPTIFAGYGHLPHVECPDRFTEAVLRFLDEAEA